MPPVSSPLLTSLLLAVLSLWAPIGSLGAQDTRATRAAAARALFADGVAAADAGQWDVAADCFRSALALRESAVIELNLALAEGHRGRVVEGAELLQSLLRRPAVEASIREAAEGALTRFESRIAWARVHVSGDLSAYELRIDGRVASPELASGPIPLDPGAHRFALIRDAREVAALDVDMAEGIEHQVSLEVPSPPEARPVLTTLAAAAEAPRVRAGAPPEALTLSPSSGPDGLAWGLGVGAGVLVLGGVSTLVLVFALPGEPMAIQGTLGSVEVGR